MKKGQLKPFAVAHVSIKNNKTGRTHRTGHKVKIFVDSGASISILPEESREFIEKRTGAFEELDARIQTANGVREAKALKDASVCLDSVCFRGNLLVSGDIPGGLLIGTDFLTQAKCKVDFEKRTLSCGGKTLPFQLER